MLFAQFDALARYGRLLWDLLQQVMRSGIHFVNRVATLHRLQADPERFPSGIPALASYIHDRCALKVECMPI